MSRLCVVSFVFLVLGASLAAPRNVQAQTGGAVDFDGAGDYMVAGALNPGSNFTVEAWVQFDSVSTGQAILAAASLGDSLNAFYLGYYANGDQWLVELDDDDPYEGDDCASDNTLCTAAGISAGVPIHLAVVVQGTQYSLYVDGVFSDSGTASSAPSFGTDLWTIGAETDSSLFGADALNGSLDEVRVWSIARSEADIQCTMDWALTGSEAGLYARWAMDDSPFAIFAEDSAGSWNANLYGDPTFGSSPMTVSQSVGGDIPCLNSSVDADGDGFSVEDGDCDDGDPLVFPGATESCDGLDNDCDGATDESMDDDGDGFVPCGVVPDCDDSNSATFPGAVEQCDGEDNDCDGLLGPDEVDPDGDLWLDCEGDCEPENPLVNPGAPEACNGEDDDCSGSLDWEEADEDGDGYRPCSGDCDDQRPQVHPLADEDCEDSLDNDCDGFTDGADPDCASGDDDDSQGDDDDSQGDDDDSQGDDDDSQGDDDDITGPAERREGCDCGNGVTGETGLSFLIGLSLLSGLRRRRDEARLG